MERRWWHELAVFDLETTGIDVATSRIVTAHVGVIDASGHAIESMDWLADPGVEIPEQATAVHGVSTEFAREHGRPAREVVAEIVLALDTVLSAGLPVVIYNAPYDLSLLAHEVRRHGVRPLEAPRPIVDPLVLDKAVDRFRKGKRTLTATAEHYSVDLTDAHTAGADAVAAGRVAQAIASAYEDRLGTDVHELHERQIRWCAAQAASFEEYMRRTKDAGFVADRDWPMRPLVDATALQQLSDPDLSAA